MSLAVRDGGGFTDAGGRGRWWIHCVTGGRGLWTLVVVSLGSVS